MSSLVAYGSDAGDSDDSPPGSPAAPTAGSSSERKTVHPQSDEQQQDDTHSKNGAEENLGQGEAEEHLEIPAEVESLFPPLPSNAEVDAAQDAQVKGFLSKHRAGYSVNNHLVQHKAFRNPCIMEKIVTFYDIKERGSSFDKSVFDPDGFSKEEFFDALREQQAKHAHKLSAERRARGTVEFQPAQTTAGIRASTTGSGTSAVVAAAAQQAAALAARSGRDPIPRSSSQQNIKGALADAQAKAKQIAASLGKRKR